MKLRPGLVSISFRALSAEGIIALVSEAGLQGIEWGGDVHVPPRDVARAREVGRLTREAGLQVAAYGSYYRVGYSENESLPFESVLESARELGAPLIRVWAGRQGSAQSDAAHWARMVEELQRIADMAREADIRLAWEYHGGTLTDSLATTQRLMDEMGAATRETCGTLWQPQVFADSTAGITVEDAIESNATALQELLPHLANLHVYWWTKTREGTFQRRPLSEGEAAWQRYLSLAANAERQRWALLEFVRGDDPQALLEDARTLRRWIDNAS